MTESKARSRDFVILATAMVAIITASNWLVQFAINDWLTWAAFTYPVSFLVTDLTNRRLGPGFARRVVYAGFAVGVLLSAVLATPRIALASGSAFLAAQLLDVFVFHRLREQAWWMPPLASSLMGSAVDTALFFGIAFAGIAVPWITLALGDFAIKVAMAIALLAPFRVVLAWTAPASLPVRSGRPS